MRDLLEKVSRLETQKDDLESELEVKVSSTRDLETSLHQRSMEQSTAVQMANTRADSAERRVSKAQTCLSGTIAIILIIIVIVMIIKCVKMLMGMKWMMMIMVMRILWYDNYKNNDDDDDNDS